MNREDDPKSSGNHTADLAAAEIAEILRPVPAVTRAITVVLSLTALSASRIITSMTPQANEILVTKATESDLPIILSFIQALAEYERLRDSCIATEERLRATLFADHPAAEVLIARIGDEPFGFALFFHNYSTFLAQRGVFLEDLFVKPDGRGRGVGRALLIALARIAIERDCGRLEWLVLDWNESAIGFYKRIDAKALDDFTTFRIAGEALQRLAAERAS